MPSTARQQIIGIARARLLLGPVLISSVIPSVLRWHCHTSAVDGQVFPSNPRLPSQWDCYSFLSRHLWSTRLSQPCGGLNPLPSDIRAWVLTTQLSSRPKQVIHTAYSPLFLQNLVIAALVFFAFWPPLLLLCIVLNPHATMSFFYDIGFPL